MICRICREECYEQTYTEPAEPCLCGEMATCDPWHWSGWRGLLLWFRHRLAERVFKFGNWLIGI